MFRYGIFFCCFLGLLTSFFVSVFSWGRVIDDSYYSFRAAYHLIEGLGLRWNIGSDFGNGLFSMPLLVLSALSALVGGDVVVAANSLGIFCGIAICLVSSFYIFSTTKKAPNRSSFAILGSAIFVALVLSYRTFSIKLAAEPVTMLFSLLVLCWSLLSISILSGTVKDRYRSGLFLSGVCFALILTRLDGLFFALAGFLILAMCHKQVTRV